MKIKIKYHNENCKIKFIKKDYDELFEIKDAKEQAFYYKETVTVAMDELRKPADELEKLVDKKVWPFPTYADLIFEV